MGRDWGMNLVVQPSVWHLLEPVLRVAAQSFQVFAIATIDRGLGVDVDTAHLSHEASAALIGALGRQAHKPQRRLPGTRAQELAA